MNGINDQIVALQWVQREIRNFGGDPDRVTIFGDSSGGYSVCTLTVSPRVRARWRVGVVRRGGGPWLCWSFALRRFNATIAAATAVAAVVVVVVIFVAVVVAATAVKVIVVTLLLTITTSRALI
jgi:hypothetical protein